MLATCGEYRNLSGLLKALGGLWLLTGIGLAFVGPIEMYCFYLFSEGGRFHYEGFGFGSLMFVNIATQVAGYYIIAGIGLTLGYGHIKLRRWAHDLAQTLIASWLVVGLPLTLIALLMYSQAKDPSAIAFLAALLFAAILYPLGPLLLLRLYQGHDVSATFEHADPRPSRLAATPLRVRVLCVLLILNILAMHGAILCNGLFPFFGVMLHGLGGIVALDTSILLLGALTWGLAALKPWAWWAALITFAALAVSTVLTLARYTIRDLLALMRFAPLERDALEGLPFQDQHLAIIAALPLLVTLAITAWAWRSFSDP